MTLQKSDKIFVAGHRGLVGQAIVKSLKAKGYENILVRTRAELDLTNEVNVRDFLSQTKPDVVFLAAAKVGGIAANNSFRADFIIENLKIQNNVIWGSHQANVRRLVFLGSSCIYPKLAQQPMHEKEILSGPLEYTNQPYAIAKIAGLELVQSLRRQYQRDYFSAMPTNLYGPGDNFDLENSHVLPALIRKVVTAKAKDAAYVDVWGSGRPLREFMYSEDCADAVVHLAEKCSYNFFEELGYSHINVGTGQEISIKDLAATIAEVVGFQGELRFDPSRPDGTPRKLLDVSNLKSLAWNPRYTLSEGLRSTLAWYEQNRIV